VINSPYRGTYGNTKYYSFHAQKRSYAKLSYWLPSVTHQFPGLVTDAIEKMLEEETSYENAKKRQIALMRKGFDLGWQKPETRDELHER
jgi:hypothetical protein